MAAYSNLLLKVFPFLKQFTNYRVPALKPLLISSAWLISGLIVACVLSKALLYSVQKYLSARQWLPSHFQISTHFSNSVFLTVAIANTRIIPLLAGKGLFGIKGLMVVRKFISSRFTDTIEILFILAMTWMLIKAVGLLKIILYTRLDISNSNNLKERKIRTQIQFLERLILIFLYVIAGGLVLMSFDSVRKFGTSLIASAGLAGVVLGVAAQKSLANLLAGFQIAFTQPIRIDDVVVVEGEWGRIEEITLTYVVVRIWDKRTLILPIGYFIEKPFQNWTRATADVIGTVFLYVDYSLPLNLLRMEFQKVLNSCSLWDGHTSAVQVTNFTERVMEVRLLAGARNSQDAFDLRCIVREELIVFIQKHFPNALPQFRFHSDENRRRPNQKTPRDGHLLLAPFYPDVPPAPAFASSTVLQPPPSAL